MNPVDGMEFLIEKLMDTESNKDFLNNISKGVYFLKIVNLDGSSKMEKFVVN